ncbi:MAG: low temperature requirement protein A [Actinomycetota bacterium]|nr:low temperature requirement protein A [Actinomycetota bacterium]
MGAEPDLTNDDQRRVSALELFFDLVFVFAITRTTELLGEDATATGLLRGLVVLAVVWWAWDGYAWLTNEVDTERDAVRLSIFAAMAAMLIVALAIPGAFGADATLFAAAYASVRLVHVVLYTQASGDDGGRLAVRRLMPSIAVACALLFGAAAVDGTAQTLLWVAAVAADYLGLLVTGTKGWRVQASHFAERHSLIVLIALGESVVDIGAGVRDEALGAGVVTAALLAATAIAAMWWAYFDVVAPVAERRMRAAAPEDRVALARDSYTFLHLPMVAGIVLLAAGIKQAIGHVGDPLETVPAIELCGGPALYLVAHILFRLRNVHSLNRQRIVAAVALVALIPVSTSASALTALTLVAAILTGLITYEALRFREARARIRAGGGSVRFSPPS